MGKESFFNGEGGSWGGRAGEGRPDANERSVDFTKRGVYASIRVTADELLVPPVARSRTGACGAGYKPTINSQNGIRQRSCTLSMRS